MKLIFLFSTLFLLSVTKIKNTILSGVLCLFAFQAYGQISTIKNGARCTIESVKQCRDGSETTYPSLVVNIKKDSEKDLYKVSWTEGYSCSFPCVQGVRSCAVTVFTRAKSKLKLRLNQQGLESLVDQDKNQVLFSDPETGATYFDGPPPLLAKERINFSKLKCEWF